MMRTTAARLSILTVASAPLAASVLVAPDSPCSRYCGNVLSSTPVDEVPCDAGTLTKTSKGLVWEQCVDCLLTSTYVSPGNQTDLQALLYNMRMGMGTCLFGGPANPCITKMACEPLKDAVQYQNFSTTVGPFDYCKSWEHESVSHCGPCLIPLDKHGIYLNNYMTILEAGCQQKPAPGSTISIDGDPFDATPLVIIPPHQTYATTPSPDYGPISLGARVGIAFGVLAALLAIIGFCIVCNGKRRRRAFLRELERRHGGPGWPHPKSRYGGGGGSSGEDMFETPVSQRPLRGWGGDTNSPVSDMASPAFPRYFSPYSSNYNSPVTGPEGGGGPGPSGVAWPTSPPTQQQLEQMVMLQQGLSPVYGGSSPPPPGFTQWPTVAQEKMLMQMEAHHERRQNELAMGLAMGGAVNANGYPVESKGKERDEAYEMHEVESPYGNGNGEAWGRQYEHPYRMPAPPQAPVLHHPGYGRHHGERGGAGGAGVGLGLGG